MTTPRDIDYKELGAYIGMQLREAEIGDLLVIAYGKFQVEVKLLDRVEYPKAAE